jgi:hypothetical protein
MTHRIKEHITCGHDDMTYRIRERNPNGKVFGLLFPIRYVICFILLCPSLICWGIFCMCPTFYFDFSIRIAFPNPMCHMLYIVMSTCDVFFYPMRHIYPMEENNPKGQYKVKHRTHTIPDHIPSGHGNIKHMTYPMEENNPKGQNKVKHRTHTISIFYFILSIRNASTNPLFDML